MTNMSSAYVMIYMCIYVFTPFAATKGPVTDTVLFALGITAYKRLIVSEIPRALNPRPFAGVHKFEVSANYSFACFLFVFYLLSFRFKGVALLPPFLKPIIFSLSRGQVINDASS